jgi:hypothetical protein
MRSIRRIQRQPDLLVGFTIQPIMFVLLFVYVFGGAIATPGLDYVDFLMPGILVQSIAFGGFVTALGLAEDIKKGLIDRFRSLPMWGPAVVSGRILADIGTNLIQLAVMLPVGIAAGFRFDNSALQVLAGPRPAATRLRVLVGVRLHRADCVVARGLERLRLHHSLPDHLHLVGLRAGGVDAGLAAGLREDQSLHDDGRRGALALPRHAGPQRRLGRRRLGLRHHRRFRLAVGVALPPHRLALTRRGRVHSGHQVSDSSLAPSLARV